MFDYDTAGLLKTKTWYIGNLPFPVETWIASFVYDPIGRLDTLTYPMSPTETTPLSVKHVYDPYTGDVMSLTDGANSTAPLWQGTTRDERGQFMSEIMRMPGTTAQGIVTRSSSYFPQTGQLKDSTLNSGTNSAVLSYTYQADGVPNTKGMSGVGGAWTEKFDYDNLDRLTSWTPDAGAPLVTYGYNSGGDLTSRIWSGETVTYGPMQVAAGIQTMTVQDQRGTQSTFDAYKFDLLGRAFETPAASIVMADDDKPAKVTEANGQVDTLIYDALGNRIMTLYGANGSAGSLVTLDGQFELKRDAARAATTTQARCRLNANGRVIGDVVRTGTGQRTGTFYFDDIVHSIVAEASPDGTLVARSRRDPFGNTFSSATTPFLPADPTSANPDGSSRLGFGGHDRDSNWGLVDMLARSYSPRLGRFVSPDSLIGNLFDRRDHNPFSYVRNNPIVSFDPSGRWGELYLQGAAEASAAESSGIGPFSQTDYLGYGGGEDNVSYAGTVSGAAFVNATVSGDTGATSAGVTFEGSRPAYDPIALTSGTSSGEQADSAHRWVNSFGEACIGVSCTTSTGGIYSTAMFADAPNIQVRDTSTAWEWLSQKVTTIATLIGALEFGAASGKSAPGLPTEESWGNPDTLGRHFGDHGADFGSASPRAYADEASAFLQRSQTERLPTKIDANGVIRVYDTGTNTFGSFNSDGTTRTLFNPSSPTYWTRQPGIEPWTPGDGQ